MDALATARWMLSELHRCGCVYQDDVVDYLVKADADSLMRENADGNLVIGRQVLASFLSLTETSVVWVKPDWYWRWRVPEDDPGREARG